MSRTITAPDVVYNEAVSSPRLSILSGLDDPNQIFNILKKKKKKKEKKGDTRSAKFAGESCIFIGTYKALTSGLQRGVRQADAAFGPRSPAMSTRHCGCGANSL